MIYDISPTLSNFTRVWPGEPNLQREVLADIDKGDTVTVSILHSTVHIGAHADAPSHIIANEDTIGEVDLDYYIGQCQVIQINCQPNDVITLKQITQPILAERILLKTLSFYDRDYWAEDFAALSPELVDYLQEKGVKLIGVDTPSVDPFHSKTLDAHRRFVANKMAILEGLYLSDIKEGLYELIALPLKLIGFDASPVRAILRTIV